MFTGIIYLIIGIGIAIWFITQFSFIRAYKVWVLIPWAIVGILLSLLTAIGALVIIFNF